MSDEVLTEIPPVSIRRVKENTTLLGIHVDRPDGCATTLTTEQCQQIAHALCPAPPQPQPFHAELKQRINARTGKNYGAASWLARQLDIAEMTTGRYLHGTSIPTPNIARRISDLLDWDYRDLVQSVVHAKTHNTAAAIHRKYHRGDE